MTVVTHRLGVDLGGTKIEAIILDADNQILVRQRIPTPSDDYDALLSAVSELCRSVEAEAAIVGALPLGIGVPGSRSPVDGIMRNCNSVVLNGKPLLEDLEAQCDRPVRLANDADCFALSEARDGASQGFANSFGVILGTGVGAGIVLNGEMLNGPNALCGEWGHNALPLERVRFTEACLQQEALGPDQHAVSLGAPRPCYCGRYDCVETWLSGPGLAMTHAQLHGAPLDVAKLHATPLADPETTTLELYCDMLAAALATVVNVLDPQIIVLGGGLSNIDYLYHRVPAKLAEKVFSDSFSTPIVRAQHGDSGGVRGAAWLWP